MESVIIDLDGTVSRSQTVIPGAREGIDLLRDRGYRRRVCYELVDEDTRDLPGPTRIAWNPA